eukprot:TRINITY_DN91753_c0_g1_i1.p1 TRINITY_DN91753_c0_g1~~TRINITY_DN91753_c0_g1_i1.p1  ORF type:complete len:525 (-),score=157.88 TRINITY_DN91753_c0_g1_i1:82-1656(-)
MPPKGKKKDPNAPCLIPEDTFQRAKKLKAVLDPKTLKPPKGELKEEEWVIPPSYHSLPELKQVIQFYKQGGVVQYGERKAMQAPTKMTKITDEAYLVDNSVLKSTDNAVLYRISKQLDDKDPTGTSALFGSTVYGTDEGDGWLKVGNRYLPINIRGSPVLVLLAQAAVKRPHPWKEVKDLQKYIKSMYTQAKKRKDKYLTQLEKKEKKMTKREDLKAKIDECESMMSEELRNARRFEKKQQLFEKKYMIGSKLGERCPKQKALILLECSDKQATYVEEGKDEVTKLIRTIFADEDEGLSTYQIATFSGAGQSIWFPGAPFQAKDDPKKGLEDSLKWINKNFSAKTCQAQGFPPDWCAMLNKFCGEGATLPYRVYVCCSKMPDNHEEVLELMNELRKGDAPSKEGMLPLNIVAFDASIVGDDDEAAWFNAMAGPNGTFMIDTSQEDLKTLDGILKSVAAKNKMLGKLQKKLIKMEDKDGKDLPDRVAEDRSYFAMSVALLYLLENDFEILTWAMNNEEPLPGPEI